MSRYSEKYKNEVAPALMTKFAYKSPMQIPRFDKIVINVGVGDARENAKVIDSVIDEITMIAGQKAVPHLRKKIGRELQGPSGHEDRRQGDAPRRADVRVYG